MMSSRACPRCRTRVPYGAQRCVGCGSEPNCPHLRARRRTLLQRTTGVAIILFALFSFFAVTYSDRYLPTVADWYARTVFPFVPVGMDPLLPLEEEVPEEAFRACLRRVVAGIASSSAIATFAGSGAMGTRRLDGGAYEFVSMYEVVEEGGERMPRSFTCRVRMGRRAWAVERLEVRDLAADAPFLPARSLAGGGP